MTDELADVIHGAIGEYRIGSPTRIGDFIAAAIRQHLASEAVVERMARTFDADAFNYFDESLPYLSGSVMDGYRFRQIVATNKARAAIAAATGGGNG